MDFNNTWAVYCRPNDTNIVSGKAYKFFGTKYDYYPILKEIGPSR